MNRADLWLGNNAPNAQPGNVEVRGMDTARLIAARPVTIVISRKVPGENRTIQLPPQTVRLEVSQTVYGAKEVRDPMESISRQFVVLIGILGNPTIPDTDVLRGDLFLYGNLMYEVIEAISTVPGRLLVSCEATP